MVFGYNGLGHLGIDLPGARDSAETGVARIDPKMPAEVLDDLRPTIVGKPREDPTKVESRQNPAGWGKLFDGHLGVAIGWLYPLSLLALLYGLWRRAERTDPVRGGFVMWGVWLLTFGVIFSATTVPHTAYVASLAPPVAALSGVGIVLFWRAYRRGGRQAWLLPLAVAAEMVWVAWLWSHYPGFLPWARWGTLVLGTAAVVVLVLARKAKSAALVTAALAIGAAAMVAGPATYAVSVLDPDYSGASFDANAGPESGRLSSAPTSDEPQGQPESGEAGAGG
jgi:4-amino-4-deoxy-L-arabinose transferase-like glycosyltransferase